MPFLDRNIRATVHFFIPFLLSVTNDIVNDSFFYSVCHGGFLDGSAGKETACKARDMGSILGSGRSPRGGHGNSLQHSCLETPMDREAWRATVQSHKDSEMTEATEHTCPHMLQ